MNKDDNLYCCPICGEPHDVKSYDRFDMEMNTYVRSNICQKCSCKWTVSVEGLVFNVSIQDYAQFKSVVKGSIKESEKKEYEALKTLFNLLDIKAVKRYPIENVSHEFNGKEIVERRRSEKPIVELITPYGFTHYNVLLTLTEKEYEEKYKFLFEKEEKENVKSKN